MGIPCRRGTAAQVHKRGKQGARLLLCVSSVTGDLLSVWKPSIFGAGGSGLRMAEVEVGCNGLNFVPPKIPMLEP